VKLTNELRLLTGLGMSGAVIPPASFLHDVHNDKVTLSNK